MLRQNPIATEILGASGVSRGRQQEHDPQVLALLIAFLAAARSMLQTRADLAIENLALRQQLGILQRRRPRGFQHDGERCSSSPEFPLEGYRRAPEGAAGSNKEVESFPTQLFETADVSLVEGTIAGCNYSFFFTSPRNGIEEADGSIPFSSTKLLVFF